MVSVIYINRNMINTYVDIVNICSNYFAIFVRWEQFIATLKGNRPMHQEQIKVFHTQVIKSILQRLSNIVWVMLIVP